MTEELYWLILTVTMTALFWIPYIINRIAVRGLMNAMANPSPEDKEQADWAIRSQAAHANAIKNIVIFAPLVITTHILEVGIAMTANACMAYFIARLGYHALYTGRADSNFCRWFYGTNGTRASFARRDLIKIKWRENQFALDPSVNKA